MRGPGRAAAAFLLLLALVWATLPMAFVRIEMRRAPLRTVAVGLLALLLAYLLVRGVEAVVRWACRGPREVSERGLLGFLLGLVSAVFGLSLYFACASVLTGPVGLYLGISVIRRESHDRLGHSFLNLTGIALNALGLLILVSQIRVPGIWR